MESGAPSGLPRVPLTPREVEVLELRGQGLGNKEAAAELGLSVDTVKTHVKSALAKVGAYQRKPVWNVARALFLLASNQNQDIALAPDPRLGGASHRNHFQPRKPQLCAYA